jgi:hypothetical protein
MTVADDVGVRVPHLVLVGLAVAAAGAAVAYAASPPTGAAERSPDREWSLLYSRRNGYGRLDLTYLRTGRTYRMYRSNDSCCDAITWVRPHLLIFVDDYNVKTLDPPTRRVFRIAGFSEFTISHDGRLVAGYAESGGHAAETVDVVPITGGRCRAVPRRPDQDDSSPIFSRDDKAVTVVRQHFDLRLGYAVGQPRRITVPLRTLTPVKAC